MKIYESELKIMNLLWQEGDLAASDIVQKMKDATGWNKNTTYTVIKKLVEKGAIERIEPKFFCHAIIKREQVQQLEANELLDKLFDGSISSFFSTFLGDEKVDKKHIDELKKLIEEHS